MESVLLDGSIKLSNRRRNCINQSLKLKSWLIKTEASEESVVGVSNSNARAVNTIRLPDEKVADDDC